MRAPTSRAARPCCAPEPAADLARDRRAGGARPRRGRRVSAAAGCDLLDRQRDRGARHRRCAPARSTTPTRPSSAPRSRSSAARRCISASSPTTKTALARRARREDCESDVVDVLRRHVEGRRRPFLSRGAARSRNPGIVAHGVALKPGKPICLAVTDGKPVVILPGFPTSAIFTFHEFVAPVIRAYAGLPVERTATSWRRRCRCA